MDECLFMKILVVGDSSAGKTSFLRRLCYDIFEQDTNQTVGCDYCMKTIENMAKKVIKLQLWEIAGIFQFYFMINPSGQGNCAVASKLYIRGAIGVFIIADLTNPQGLESALRWRQIIMEGDDTFESKDIPIIIIQNKLDRIISDKKDFQSETYLHEFVSKNHFSAGFQVSAKTGENINETIEVLVREVLKMEQEGRRNRTSRFTLSEDSLLRLSKHSLEASRRKSMLFRANDTESKENSNCAC